MTLIIYFFSDVEHLSEDQLPQKLRQNKAGRQNPNVDINPPEGSVEVTVLGPLCIILYNFEVKKSAKLLMS